MSNEQKLREEAARAAKVVRTWPAWKQSLLLNSLKATNDYCRLTVRKQSRDASSRDS